MAYGIYETRRYEAVQRLLWFLFFLLCLTGAYFLRSNKPALQNVQLKDAKTFQFWYGLHGIMAVPPVQDPARPDLNWNSPDTAAKPKPGASPEKASPGGTGTPDLSLTDKPPQLLGRLVVFLVQVAVIFILGKLAWLLLQFLGKFIAQHILSGSTNPASPAFKPDFGAAVNPELLFPAQQILRKVNRVPGGFLLHSVLRLKLMLVGGRPNLSSQDLVEKERRIVDADWQVLNGSWTPFNWLLWILPVLALGQTAWLIVLHFHHASATQKEFIDTLQTIPLALLPLGQALGLVIFFKLACGLLRRMEDLYLSGLDALIYDRLLSRLPFHSGDTLILLDVLQRQFKQINSVLRRMERIASEKADAGREG